MSALKVHRRADGTPLAYSGIAAYQGEIDGDSFIVLARHRPALRRIIAGSSWHFASDERKWERAAVVPIAALQALEGGGE